MSNPFPYVREAAYKDDLESIDSADELGDLLAPARTTWAAAGGAAPSFGAYDGGGGATPIGLGTTGKVQVSSFNRIGAECNADARIVGGTGSTAGVGYWTLLGLPFTPKADGAHGRLLGYAYLLDASDNFRYYSAHLIYTPAVSGTLFMVTNAAEVEAVTVQDPEATATALGVPEGTLYAHDDFPFSFAESDIVHLKIVGAEAA